MVRFHSPWRRPPSPAWVPLALAGLVLAFAGSVGGEWLGFELVRRYGTAWASRMIGDEQEMHRLNTILTTHGAAAVAH